MASMDDIQRRFLRFHEENPHVYDLLRRFSLQARRRGRTRFSIDAIYHRARWHTQIETTDPDWKLNDHYTSRYARKLMDEEPELEGFFELRDLRRSGALVEEWEEQELDLE